MGGRFPVSMQRARQFFSLTSKNWEIGMCLNSQSDAPIWNFGSGVNGAKFILLVGEVLRIQW